MRSLTIAAVLLATALALATASSPLDLVDDLIASPSSPEAAASLPPPPVKLDKNLRRALLKALSDLEAESAEQQQQHDENSTDRPYGNDDDERSSADVDENRYDFLEISKQKSTSFSFDGFPAEEDTPSEDKLQNTTFVESDKYANGDEQRRLPAAKQQEQKQHKDYTKGVQVHHVVPTDKHSGIYESKPPGELLDTVESRSISSSTSSPAPRNNTTTASASLIQQSVTFAPIVQETLQLSASGNVASAANSLLPLPRPTAATINGNNGTSKTAKANKEEAEDVKIFQAPLVAAFTVQQDERGVPRNIVPLYKSNSAQQQPLSLQEQLEFKQRLLEKQLAQLQAQQAQQTQFLLRQRQAYEEQARQKQQQQHEYYLQEQRRLKLLQEQEQQRLRLQQQQQQQRTFQPASIVQQQLPLPQQQTLFKQQQQQQQQQGIFKPNNVPQQQQSIFKQQQFNNVQQQSSFNNLQQPPLKNNNNVQFQPSLSLEVPSAAPALPFQRTQSFQQQPFQPVDFQQPPAASSTTRFHRQEAFNAVGNFGFNSFQNNNDDKSIRQSQFVQQQRQQQNNNFGFNPAFRQRQLVTPARQIQELLYQSGIAGDLQGAGTRNQEDVNIVSKVLALNVGALTDQQQQRAKGFQQFGGLKKKK